MDARSQQILEFPLIRERLAAHTAFAPSRRLVEALTPSNDAVVVARLLDETDQARDLVARRPDLGVGGAHDIAPLVMRARRGGRLSGPDLLAIQETLSVAARVGEALRGERPALLHELGRAIKPLPQLRARLEQSIDPAGELLDSASPALGGLRRAVRVAYERLRSRLETIVHQSDISGALQEPLVTLRNGRYVVPVPCRRAGQGQGHRSRPVRQRADALHRAPRRRRAGQHVARGAAHGTGRGGTHPR